MPQQESFLRESANGTTVEVIKTYDKSYAREVFSSVDDEALKSLAMSLELAKNYEPADIPDPEGPDYDDFLWIELCDAATEDVRQSPVLSSFFVVKVTKAGKSEDRYISADWPSAEKYAQNLLVGK